MMTMFSAVGADFSETERTSAEIEAYYDALADMFCAHSGALVTEAGLVGRPHSATGANGLMRAIIERSMAGFSGLLITVMSS